MNWNVKGFSMLNISQVILMRTDSNLCRKELTVHWSAPNSLIRSYLQPCTNAMWGDESEGVAPIIWLYQIVDAQKEEVVFPELLITLRSYAHGSKNCRIWPKLAVSGLQLQFEFTNGYDMMHKAWSSIEEVPYCVSRSSVKFQGHAALKIIEFDLDWAFPDCNSSLNSPMATKWCTKLEVA